VIGIDDHRTYVASETSAFNQYTRQFIAMKDGEIGVLHKEGCSLDLSRVQTAPDQKVILSPAPYPHWTIRECLEQPFAVSEAMNNGGRLGEDGVVKLGGIDLEAERLSKIRFLTISACGTSLNAAKYGERLMKDLRSFDAVASIDSAETTENDFFHADSWSESGLLVLSQSGETKGTMAFCFRE
jgi:glucosamine--fructose-6-phosphate aminotransferase (isomerizing)